MLRVTEPPPTLHDRAQHREITVVPSGLHIKIVLLSERLTSSLLESALWTLAGLAIPPSPTDHRGRRVAGADQCERGERPECRDRCCGEEGGVERDQPRAGDAGDDS